jgi:hypothetical protein
MRANTRLDHRLAFDRVAVEYDDGRPTFGYDLIQSVADMTGLVPGDQVIEIGAGTGQLTAALLSMGLVVTALEPGAAMRAILAEREGGHLCLLWNYPVVRPDIQCRLNESAFRQHPDFAGDEQSMLTATHQSAADGRQQLVSSGLFDMSWWQWRTEQALGIASASAEEHT